MITSSPYKNAIMENQLKTKGKGKQTKENCSSTKMQSAARKSGEAKKKLKLLAKKPCKKTEKWAGDVGANKSASSNTVTADDTDVVGLRGHNSMETDTAKETCSRPKRMRKQLFSLAQAVQAIVADSDGDSANSDIEL